MAAESDLAHEQTPARIIFIVLILRFLVVLLLAGMGFSQSMDREFPSSHTILIFPFENTSNVP